MFFPLLAAILALQAYAFVFGADDVATAVAQPHAETATPDKSRLDALREVIACGVAKIENTDMVESDEAQCAKQIAAYNEISAAAIETREAQQ
jgi:hypothetical protein